ncbi:MAG TPA: hypothetical protein VMT30_00060 [Candidatus Saccharimonadia bacterium]|nr:hypothetical protein [Candidatus Saccharimonadia bacterium]
MASNLFVLPFNGLFPPLSLAIREKSEDIIWASIDCQGIDFASAAVGYIENDTLIRDVVLVANYVDASNYAIKLDTSIYVGQKYTVIASATVFPAAGDIEVFLDPQVRLIDGNSSVIIPRGTAKTFIPVAWDSINSVNIWAAI